MNKELRKNKNFKKFKDLKVKLRKKIKFKKFKDLQFKFVISDLDKNTCKCLKKASAPLKSSKPGDLKKLREKEEKKEAKRDCRVRPNLYPDSSEITMKILHIPWTKELSWAAKLTLNSFQKKHLYYAIDDILYAPNMALEEKDDLLALLYSPALLLHNTDSINFFDIWINELYIKEILKTNRFLNNKFRSSYQITIKVLYKIRSPRSKLESLW